MLDVDCSMTGSKLWCVHNLIIVLYIASCSIPLHTLSARHMPVAGQLHLFIEKRKKKGKKGRSRVEYLRSTRVR